MIILKPLVPYAVDGLQVYSTGTIRHRTHVSAPRNGPLFGAAIIQAPALVLGIKGKSVEPLWLA